jgi:hypothetical protein
MAVDSLQISAQTARRGPGRPFVKGQSGNPAGRPRGSRNRMRELAELLDDQAEALLRSVVTRALEGDAIAMRLCVERILAPRRERPMELDLPPIQGAADISGAMAAVTTAATQGNLTPGEAATLSKVVETYLHAIEATDFEYRLRAVEASVAEEA